MSQASYTLNFRHPSLLRTTTEPNESSSITSSLSAKAGNTPSCSRAQGKFFHK
jgi:hypothetical protein